MMDAGLRLSLFVDGLQRKGTMEQYCDSLEHVSNVSFSRTMD